MPGSIERSQDHYCRDCAIKIIEQDIVKLQALAQLLKSNV